MSEQGHGGRFRELQDDYADYTVYDQHYEKIGKVDDLFIDDDGRELYIGVKTGTFGMRSTLIPMELVRVNDLRRLVEVAASKETIENAPNFSDDEEISGDLERRIYAHFGDPRPETLPNASDYFSPSVHDGPVDTEYGERAEVPLHPPERPDTAGWIDPSVPDEPVAEDRPDPAEPPLEDRSDEQIRVHRLRRE